MGYLPHLSSSHFKWILSNKTKINSSSVICQTTVWISHFQLGSAKVQVLFGGSWFPSLYCCSQSIARRQSPSVLFDTSQRFRRNDKKHVKWVAILWIESSWGNKYAKYAVFICRHKKYRIFVVTQRINFNSCRKYHKSLKLRLPINSLNFAQQLQFGDDWNGYWHIGW